MLLIKSTFRTLATVQKQALPLGQLFKAVMILRARLAHIPMIDASKADNLSISMVISIDLGRVAT